MFNQTELYPFHFERGSFCRFTLALASNSYLNTFFLGIILVTV